VDFEVLFTVPCLLFAVMLTSAIVPPINHLLRQNNWARQKLRAHKHKTAEILLPPFTFFLTVSEEGEVAAAAQDAVANVSLSLNFPLLLRILAGDEAAANEVPVSGDAEFAADINTIARNLRYDAEEDLSRVVGDVAAHRIAAAGRDFVAFQTALLANFASSLKEFLTYEQPLLADPSRVREFITQVDELRDAAARLEKRIEKLGARP
jgi:ubiquinone biosynthesis protein UbiJ